MGGRTALRQESSDEYVYKAVIIGLDKKIVTIFFYGIVAYFHMEYDGGFVIYLQGLNPAMTGLTGAGFRHVKYV